MRIYNRQEFLKLNTVLFAKGCEWSFNDLCIKGDTWFDNDGKAIDFLYLDLSQIDSTGSNDMFDSYIRMLETGESIKMNESLSRDGSFDDEDIFMVYEVKDLAVLYIYIKQLLNKSNQKFEYFIKACRDENIDCS